MGKKGFVGCVVRSAIPCLLVVVLAAGCAFAGWTSRISGSMTYYIDDGLYRFAYNSANKRWYDYHLQSGWLTLGLTGMSSTLLVKGGGGAAKLLDGTCYFRYDSVSDMGYLWISNTWNYRFNYRQGTWSYRAAAASSWSTDSIGIYTSGASNLTTKVITDEQYLGTSRFRMWYSEGTGSGRKIYYSLWNEGAQRNELRWAIFNCGTTGNTLNSYKVVFERHDWPNEWVATLPGTLVVYNYDYQTNTGGPGTGVSGFVDAVANLSWIYGCKWQTVALSEHGNADYLVIGSNTLSSSTVSSYKTQFQRLSNYLYTNSQIQFYNCLVASTAGGRQMLTYIGAWTGAEVWGSNDETGFAGAGYNGRNYTNGDSDWVLEFSSRAGRGMYNGGTYLGWDQLVYQTYYMNTNQM